MKIAVDCRMIGKSGIGVYIENVLHEFIIHYSAVHYFLLVGEKEVLKEYADTPNVSFLDVNIPIFSIQELLHFPTRQINECDVFYTPNFNIPGGIRIPVYSTIHDVIFLDLPSQTSFLGRIIRYCYLWRAVKKSKKIFTVSDFSRSRILHHFPLSKGVIVTYCAISRNIQEVKTDMPKYFDFSYILFVGNIKTHKGLVVLLEAFRKAQRNGYRNKLVIVGEYQAFKTEDKVIVRLLQEKNEEILFTGKIDNPTLYNLLVNAQLFVLPSVYEGFGIPPLEALYFGCPVLLSDIPVLREIYGDLPVNFFKVNDSDDLSQKLMDSRMDRPFCDLEKIRKKIDHKYNFKFVARKIMNNLG